MSRAKRDDNFRDELRAIEQWFTVLSDPERAAALHQLLQHANYVQLRFLLTVIQKLIKEAEKDSRTLPSMGPGPIGNGRYKQRLFDRHSAPNVEEQYYRYLAGLDVAAGEQKFAVCCVVIRANDDSTGPANPSTRPSSIHERPASLHERSSIHDRPASIHERSSIHERPPSFHERPSSYHELQRPPSIHDGPGTSRPPSFHEASLGGRPLSFHETFNNRPLSFHERHDRPASFHEASSALGPQLSSALFDDANLSRRHSTVSLYGARARSDMNIPYPIKLDPLPENDGYRRSPGEPSPAPTRFDSDVWGSGTYNLRERLIGGLRDRTARGAWAPGPGGEDDWPGELPPPSTSPRPVSVPSSPIWKPPSSPARSARIGDDDEEPKISVGPVEVEQLQGNKLV